MKKQDLLYYALLATLAGLLAYLIPFVFLEVPTAQASAGGLAQKIFYFHAPIAIGLYAAGGACFVASVVYLIRPSETANAVARAGSDSASYIGAMVLASGPLWAKKAWGVYWIWDPQLTTLLLSVLIYMAVTLLRTFGGDGAPERRFAAALGIMGAINLPIIYYSVQKWGGNHPNVTREGGGGLAHPDMRHAFSIGMLTFSLVLPIVVVWLRARLALIASAAANLQEEALTRGIIDWDDDYDDEPSPSSKQEQGNAS